MDPKPLPPEQIQSSSEPSPWHDRISSHSLIILFVLILVAGAGTYIGFTSSQPPGDYFKPAQTQQAAKTTPLNLAPYTLVYGTWDSNGSSIKALDLTSGQSYLLANLPSNVKKVSVLDSNTLLYIDNTDTKDHGTQLAVYDIKKKISTPVSGTTDGFGIDDYVLSPNKRYLADWEVVASSSGALYGGKSRVYTLDLLNPEQKRLVYDETADHPVHYPRGILDNGTVYTDTFLPNSGAGWAYGMSVSNFDGSQKQDLPNMQNGTYGTQPELSPDGKYFVFAGYDGAKGDGTADVNGFRRALVTPDTIELLDTATNQRTKLQNIAQNTYPAVSWNNTSDSLIYTQVAPNAAEMGVYSYDTTAKTSQKISSNNTTPSIITGFSKNDFLIGQAGKSASNLANLGPTYTSALSNLGIFDSTTQKSSSLPVLDPFIQFVGLEPTSFFEQTASAVPPVSAQTNNQLQLETFVLKSSLAPVREKQQTTSGKCGSGFQNPGDNCDNLPLCRDLIGAEAEQNCMSKSNVMNNSTGMSDEQICEQQAKIAAGHGPGEECFDSPLYLYGTPGTNVRVKVVTPVSSSIPAYQDGYQVTLEGNGKMTVNGQKNYDKISYDYTPALPRIIPPANGTAISTTNLKQTLIDYANKLGLNSKETNNLISETLPKIGSPYVFVSFFDHNTSKAILPIQFSPQPEIYRNIVFYFKQLGSKPTYSVAPPKFEKIVRHGLTAIEVSEIVE